MQDLTHRLQGHDDRILGVLQIELESPQTKFSNSETTFDERFALSSSFMIRIFVMKRIVVYPGSA